MSNKHILKHSETEVILKVYTTNSSGEDVDISLQNDLTKSTQEYVAGSADIDETTNGDYAQYTGSHVVITGIWWGAKSGKQIDIMRIVGPSSLHNHYYLINGGTLDYRASGFADRIYAHKDIRVSFVGGEGFVILRLTKQGWNPKVETATFSIYDDTSAVGS